MVVWSICFSQKNGLGDRKALLARLDVPNAQSFPFSSFSRREKALFPKAAAELGKNFMDSLCARSREPLSLSHLRAGARNRRCRHHAPLFRVLLAISSVQ
jgi:hypothetical protein